MSSTAALDVIFSRVSPGRLTAPAPTPAHLQQILQAGARAPDHGRLRPWRFVVIGETALPRFADMMVRCALAKNPELSEADQQREREKPLRAPLIVAVAAHVTEGKIPAIEQIEAVSACTQNMMLAAHALGYGAMWKTGGIAYDSGMKQALGLEAGDAIVAFLYLGTVAAAAPARAPAMDGLVWNLEP